MSNKTIEVGVGWPLDVEVSATDIVNGLVVDHESAIGMLQGSVSGEDGVIRLDHSSGHLRGRVDGELQLGLLSVIDRKTFHKKRSKARASATTKRVEDQESLESRTLIGKLTDPVQDKVDDLLPDGIVTASIVVGGILFASDELLRVEELAVCTSAHLICVGRYRKYAQNCKSD